MKRSTKSSLLMSVVAMLLCISMLVGSTFAWFTDSVTATNNVIVAGNLDVELYYQNDETTTWEKATTTSNIFKKDTLWEPGHVEVIKLKVVNEGTLALKYNLGINIVSEIGSINIEGNPFKLSDYIKFGVVEGDQTYTREQAVAAVDATAAPINNAFTVEKELKPAGDADDNKIVTVVVYMPETVGNVANYGKGQAVPTIHLGLNVLATQLMHEKDSFDNTYDKDSVYPIISSAIVPAGATEPIDIVSGDVTTTIPAAAGEGTYTLEVTSKTVTTDALGSTTVTYEIVLKKDGVKVQAVAGVSYPVQIALGKNLDLTEVLHNGTPVVGFTYDPVTGIAKFSTDSFSPFALTYKEADGDTVFVPEDPEAADKLEEETVIAVDENGNAYTTFAAALASDASKLYLSEGADLGEFTHLNVARDLVIYGNGAYVSGGERDMAVDIYEALENDVTITVYNLHGIGVWGSRNTDKTLNVKLYNCNDLSRIYIGGNTGVNNVELVNCTASKDTLVGDTVLYSNANGTLTVDGCSFTGIGCPVNLNHKVAGTQTVTVKNTTFTDCATEGTAAYYAPIRLYNSVEDAKQTVTVEGNSFVYSEGKAPINKAYVLLNAKHDGADATGSIEGTVQADAKTVYGVNVKVEFPIYTAEELYAFAGIVNEYYNYERPYEGQTVKLMNDIDLEGAEWTPIGDYRFSANRFCGTFDGQDNTISNFKITKKTDKSDSNKSSYGFFGNMEGTVKDLTVADANVCSYAYVGALVGRMTNGTLINCHVKDSTIETTYWQAGGIIGQVNDNCTVSGCTITNSTVYGASAIGLISGPVVAATPKDGEAEKALLFENCTVKDCAIVQKGSFGSSYDKLFGMGFGYVETHDNEANINGIKIENSTLKGESSAVLSYDFEGSNIYVDGIKMVFDAATLSTALLSGDGAVLGSDIQLTERIVMKGGKLEGNGFTLSQAADFKVNDTMLYLDAEDCIINNVVFDGVKDVAGVRTLDAGLTLTNCTFKNFDHSQTQGIVRCNLGDATVKNCVFEDNTCTMALTFNYDAENETSLLVEDSIFDNNVCNDTAVLYYVGGTNCTLKNNKFTNNKISTAGNGATVYLGFTENNVVTGNRFEANEVTASSDSTRVSGGIFFGYEATVKNNAFINNVAKNANNDALGNDACVSVYYTDIDLSDNYWGGEAPENGVNYYVQHASSGNSVVVDPFLTNY